MYFQRNKLTQMKFHTQSFLFYIYTLYTWGTEHRVALWLDKIESASALWIEILIVSLLRFGVCDELMCVGRAHSIIEHKKLLISVMQYQSRMFRSTFNEYSIYGSIKHQQQRQQQAVQ